MTPRSTAQEGKLRRWVLYASIPTVIVGFLVGTQALTGWAGRGVWRLVRAAHAQSTEMLVDVAIKAHRDAGHADAATKADLTAVLVKLDKAADALVETGVKLDSAAKMAGATACAQAGGRPHPALGACVFLVEDDVELVPLDDGPALLARFKVPVQVKRALAKSAGVWRPKSAVPP